MLGRNRCLRVSRRRPPARRHCYADEYGEPDLDGATKTFMKVVRSLGIDGVTLHSTRHGVASIAISEGVDILTVSRLLGHANPTMTLGVYGHLVAGATERAIECGRRCLLEGAGPS